MRWPGQVAEPGDEARGLAQQHQGIARGVAGEGDQPADRGGVEDAGQDAPQVGDLAVEGADPPIELGEERAVPAAGRDAGLVGRLHPAASAAPGRGRRAPAAARDRGAPRRRRARGAGGRRASGRSTGDQRRLAVRMAR